MSNNPWGDTSWADNYDPGYFDSLARYETLDLYFIITDLIDFPQTPQQVFEGAFYDSMGNVAEKQATIIDGDVWIDGFNMGAAGKWVGRQKKNKKKFLANYHFQASPNHAPYWYDDEGVLQNNDDDTYHFYKSDGSFNPGGFLMGFWGLFDGLFGGYMFPSILLVVIGACLFTLVVGGLDVGYP